MHTGFLIGNPKVWTSLLIPGRRRQHNIKVDVGDMGWESVDFVHVVENRSNCGVVFNTL